MNKIKMVNGRYQYPDKGRSFHNHVVNDVNYDPQMSAVQPKNPSAIMGKAEKFFDLNMKEIKRRQGPSSYRPQHDKVMRLNPSYSMAKSGKKSHFEGTQGEGSDKYYQKPSKFGRNATHGYLSKGRRKLVEDNETPGVGTYEVLDALTRTMSPSMEFPRTGKGSLHRRPATGEIGPGSYRNMDALTKKVSGGFIGSEQKFKQPPRDAPGPGYYEPNLNATKPIGPGHGSFIGKE